MQLLLGPRLLYHEKKSPSILIHLKENRALKEKESWLVTGILSSCVASGYACSFLPNLSLLGSWKCSGFMRARGAGWGRSPTSMQSLAFWGGQLRGWRCWECCCRCCPSKKPPSTVPRGVYTVYPEEVQLLVSSLPVLEKEPGARKPMLRTPQHWSSGCHAAARSAREIITRCDWALSIRTAIRTTANHPATCQPLYSSKVWNYSGLTVRNFTFIL